MMSLLSSYQFLERENSNLEAQAMYQPALRHDQIRALYLLKMRSDRPMTALVREAVDRYLEDIHDDDSLLTTRGPLRPVDCPQGSPLHDRHG